MANGCKRSVADGWDGLDISDVYVTNFSHIVKCSSRHLAGSLVNTEGSGMLLKTPAQSVNGLLGRRTKCLKPK
jgi:hypothetical protein